MSCFHDFLGGKYPGILEVTLLYFTSIGEPDQTYQLLSNRHASQLCLLFHTVFAVTWFMAREFNNLTVRHIFSVFSVFYNIIFFWLFRCLGIGHLSFWKEIYSQTLTSFKDSMLWKEKKMGEEKKIVDVYFFKTSCLFCLCMYPHIIQTIVTETLDY